MSDNLKVAKECGATVLEDGCVIFHHSTQLDTYTSRFLASQQAAHDAEIARLKEENQRVKTDSIVVVETLKADLAAANAACAMKDEALKDLHYALYGNGTGSPKIEAALYASPQQVAEWERKKLAEAEQRGAVKALEEVQGLFIKWYVSERELHLVCASIERRDELTRLMIGATSKKAW